MAYRIIKTVVDSSGKRRIIFLESDSRVFTFLEERYWDAVPEDEGHVWGWQQVGDHFGLFPDRRLAEAEAIASIDWLDCGLLTLNTSDI
jgi:hypothetical protein